MARLANTAANFCQRLQELYPQKSALINKQSEQDSPFRRWTTGGSAASSYRHNEPRTKFSKQMSEDKSSGKKPASPWRGRVARWSLGLDQLLADLYGVAAFAKFLKEEYAEENIRFWFKCEIYRNTPDLETRARIASQIWHQFLDDRAEYAVNVDSAARTAATLGLCVTPLPTDLFDQAQQQVFALLKFDIFHRFLRSAVHAECARADLLGEAPPFGEYMLPEDEEPYDNGGASGSSAQPANSKVNKSASNASDRRRSGGSSLLPWKQRAASRDRAHKQATSQPAAAPVTDVVKQAAQASHGQPSLCRVVLPDGATSVVEVDQNLTVQRVVDRLLQRRNFYCTSYDVMIRESEDVETNAANAVNAAIVANAANAVIALNPDNTLNANEEIIKTVDGGCPSTVLGGRVAIVERRCVVRIEIGGRCVAVRCRAARRLRHVLRPVLARYAAGRNKSATQHGVLRDGCIVHPDTSMQDLDGARLQIVELTEDGELVRPEVRSRDADADSLSDLALSEPRDDDQGAASVRCRTDRPASAAGAGPGLGASAGGRVRAALRPGPPLHHHPPDFLDNLRETQRQRLQNKSEPSPAPRTPPPLPPKPPQRSAPTVV